MLSLSLLAVPYLRALKKRKEVKTALWRGSCALALFVGIGSCTGSSAISNATMYSYRACADGWPSHSIGIQGACSHHGGVVTRKIDKRTDVQRYACYALNAASIIGWIAGLSLLVGLFETKDCVSQSVHVTPPVDTPRCPRCSRPMIRRRARRGPYAGELFWGCSAYPSCRGIRQYSNTTARQPEATEWHRQKSDQGRDDLSGGRTS